MFLFSLVLLSCSSGVDKGVMSLGYTVIDVGSDVGKGRVVDLSEIASDITYIPLESKSDSFIGGVPVVFFENERIYVKSGRSFKVFDKSGKYLFTFDRRGRGPEEYVRGLPKIEKKTGNFYAEHLKGGGNSVLKTYSRDGHFKKEIAIPSVQNRLLSLSKAIPNCYIFDLFNYSKKSVVLERDNEIYSILVDTLSNVLGKIPKLPIDPRLVLKKSGKIPLNSKESSQPHDLKMAESLESASLQTIHFFKDSIRTCDYYGDTIYSYIGNNRLHPRYVMDYGKYASSKIYLNEITYYSGKLITFKNTIYYETDKFLLLYFYLRDYAHEPYFGKQFYNHLIEREIRGSYGYYNKETNKFTFLNHPKKKTPGFRDDIAEGPPFVPTYLSDDNYMITLCYAHTLIDYASSNEVSEPLKKIIDGLKDDDNPVAILVKLK